MILVRIVFRARPGRAAGVVANIKETIHAAASIPMTVRGVRIFTDLSGPFDTVVEEVEYDSLEDFMRDQMTTRSSPELRAIMARRLELIEDGYKEYYTMEFEQ